MEEKKTKKDKIKYILNNFESYIAAGMFIAICILLTIQVVSRYVFSHSISWAEELATVMFVVMIYCAYAAAVTNRKHIRITFVTDMLPFKVRKIVIIASNAIFAAFCIYIIPHFMKVYENLRKSKYPLLHIPKKNVYIVIPICLVLIAIRLVQECIKLAKEDEKNLNKSKPAIDLEACEREYLEELAAKKAAEKQEDK